MIDYNLWNNLVECFFWWFNKNTGGISYFYIFLRLLVRCTCPLAMRTIYTEKFNGIGARLWTDRFLWISQYRSLLLNVSLLKHFRKIYYICGISMYVASAKAHSLFKLAWLLHNMKCKTEGFHCVKYLKCKYLNILSAFHSSLISCGLY